MEQANKQKTVAVGSYTKDDKKAVFFLLFCYQRYPIMIPRQIEIVKIAYSISIFTSAEFSSFRSIRD